jgi:hypothetical protein
VEIFDESLLVAVVPKSEGAPEPPNGDGAKGLLVELADPNTDPGKLVPPNALGLGVFGAEVGADPVGVPEKTEGALNMFRVDVDRAGVVVAGAKGLGEEELVFADAKGLSVGVVVAEANGLGVEVVPADANGLGVGVVAAEAKTLVVAGLVFADAGANGLGLLVAADANEFEAGNPFTAVAPVDPNAFVLPGFDPNAPVKFSDFLDPRIADSVGFFPNVSSNHCVALRVIFIVSG